MTRRQVFNEHIRIVLSETIERIVWSLYLAQSKTLDWESRMRSSVILVVLLSLLFLRRNAALQISALRRVDTMSKSHSTFQSQNPTPPKAASFQPFQSFSISAQGHEWQRSFPCVCSRLTLCGAAGSVTAIVCGKEQCVSVNKPLSLAFCPHVISL